MTLIAILLACIILGAFGGYQSGVQPVYLGGGIGTILLIILVLWLMGVLPR